jgi:hypothetical protein
MKTLFVQKCQNSPVQKVNSWPSGPDLVMQIFTSLPNRPAPPPDARLVVSSVSELCFETCVNIFRREVFLAEKPNDDSLVDLATIILNVLPMCCRCDYLFRAAQQGLFHLLDGHNCGPGITQKGLWPLLIDPPLRFSLPFLERP